MVDSSVASLSVEMLEPVDFYRHAHQVVFGAMRQLAEQRIAIDPVTRTEKLRATDNLEVVGSVAYLASLTDGVPRGVNLPYYAATLRDLRLKRDLLSVAFKLQEHVLGGEYTGAELLSLGDQWLLSAHHMTDDGELVGQQKAVQELWQSLERRIDLKGALTGIDTGLTALNEMTGGWQAGDLVYLAARPSIGKTALALNIARTAAQLGYTVAVFSLEMSREQNELRLVSAMSGVMLFKILRGYLHDNDYTAISEAMNALHALPIFIDDSETINAGSIRLKCRQLKAKHGLRLVIVDYIQLMTDAAHGANRTQELASISRRFKLLAKELGATLVVLSQLNRAPEGRPDQRPRLSDLRESGALEQDADVVLMIHRQDHKAGGDAELILEKQRNGPTGVLIVNFEPHTVTFSNAISKTESVARATSKRAAKNRVSEDEA